MTGPQLGPPGQPLIFAERVYSHDLLDDFLRPTGKESHDPLDLDGALFGPDFWDLTMGDAHSPSCALLKAGIVPQAIDEMDRASSSSSSSGSGLTTVSSDAAAAAAAPSADPSTANLLAYYSYPPTYNQQVLPPSNLPASWQMMPVAPPAQHATPPYRPKWQPIPAQVPTPTPSPPFSQAPTAVLSSVKSEDMSDADDCKLDVMDVKGEAQPAMAANLKSEAEGGPVAFHMGTRVLDRKERVRRYQEKRKRRTFEKTIRYQSRKAYAEVRPRIKGRFATREEVRAMKAAAAAGLPYCPEEEAEDWDDSDDDA